MKPTAEKNYSKLEWVFYIIILPTLFISILTVVLLWFLDYDIKAKVLTTLNQIPYIEQWIEDEKLEGMQYHPSLNKEQLQLQVEELQKKLNDKTLSFTQAEKTIQTKEEEIVKLKQQIEELETQLNMKSLSEKDREEEFADLAKIYTNMNPKNAASIISNLTTEEAVLILGQMSMDAKSKIIEKMDPQQAADLSILLKDQKYAKDQDIYALQARIDQLSKQMDQLKKDKASYRDLALTYSKMDPQKAAEALLSLSINDPEKAQKILTEMEATARSTLLNQMTAEQAAKLTAGIIE